MFAIAGIRDAHVPNSAPFTAKIIETAYLGVLIFLTVKVQFHAALL